MSSSPQAKEEGRPQKVAIGGDQEEEEEEVDESESDDDSDSESESDPPPRNNTHKHQFQHQQQVHSTPIMNAHAQQWNQLPRDCIYSILPFLTLKELVCTSVRISHQWYVAAQTLRRAQPHQHCMSVREEKPLELDSHWLHRILFASSLRHHVLQVGSRKWQCNNNINPKSHPEVKVSQKEAKEGSDSDQEMENDQSSRTMARRSRRRKSGHVSRKVRSVIAPLKEIALHLPQLVLLQLDARIQIFDALESFSSVGVFPTSLRSLDLALSFTDYYFTPSVWQYVERLFELVAQQLGHSLVIFRCEVNEEPDSESDDEEMDDGPRTSMVFNAKILRHLTEMHELRILDLSTHCHIHYLPSGIDCLRAIPQLTELVSRTFAYTKQLPLLLRAPLQQKYTRIGRTLNLSELHVENHDWICSTLGRTLTHLDIKFTSLKEAVQLLPHFTCLTQLVLREIVLTDLNFLNELPHLTRQLRSLALGCSKMPIDAYRSALTPVTFPSLTTLQIITQIKNLPTLDAMFRPVNQLQPAYHTKESSKQLARELETRALKDPPGIVECTAGTIHRVPLPSLRQLTLDIAHRSDSIDEHRHALKVIHQVERETH